MPDQRPNRLMLTNVGGDTRPHVFSPEERIERLERILDGVPTEDQPGLRTRVQKLELLANELHDLKSMTRGMAILLGVLAATSLPNFITFFAKMLGVPVP